MIKSSIVKCKYCEEKILLRFQVSNYDIPFDFYCPKCGVSISGMLKTKGIELSVTNASEINEKIKNVKYYGNFSIEFLNTKISEFSSIDEINKSDFSPFIFTCKLFERYEVYEKVIRKIYMFLKFKNITWIRLKSFYELLFNYKINLLRKPMRKYSENYIIKNELDASMCLHQLTVIGMNFIMPEKTLDEYTKMSQTLMLSEKRKEITQFIDFLKNKINFDELLSKIVNIYDKWIIDFEKYMSIVAIDIGNKTKNIDMEKYGITTISFENMKTFFSESYELILEMNVIPIGLNNIFERGNYNIFSPKCSIKNFEEFYNKTKYARIEALIKDEKFSKHLILNNNIRNSIAHYDYKFNKGNQIITFYDRYKNNLKTIEVYYLEFALYCYENIKNIIYLNELYYVIRKLDYSRKGIKPNIKKNFKIINLFEND